MLPGLYVQVNTDNEMLLPSNGWNVIGLVKFKVYKKLSMTMKTICCYIYLMIPHIMIYIQYPNKVDRKIFNPICNKINNFREKLPMVKEMLR